MNYAIVDQSGNVTNVVVWDGDIDNWTPPDGTNAVAVSGGLGVGPGYTYANGVFTAPPPPPPLQF